MELIILGSGTSVPIPNRASPSLLLIAGGDSHALFDLGPGTLRQLSRIGVSHDSIDHIFITHFHPDHTADLIHFLFATRIPTVLINRSPFIITGPVGLKALIGRLRKAYNGWLDIPEEIMKIEELDIERPENRSYDNYSIQTQPLSHTQNSIAYRIFKDRGKSIVYSGDTDLCDGIVDLARDCDLLILECSFPGHLTPSKAGKVATLAGAKKLVLLHFYPEVLETDITGQCRRSYGGELILGRDMLRISL